MPTVVVEGDFVFPHNALTVANRGLFAALSRRAKYDLGLLCEPSATRMPEPAARALDALRTRRIADPDIVIRHLLPAATSQLRHTRYVHVQPWEFGALPTRWVAEWHNNVDEIWCYSSYVKDEYVQAGFPRERVHVVPLGFDPAIYVPRSTPRTVPTERRCVFLFVGGTIVRKGVDLLLAAWERAFKPTDDVALVIKDVPWYAPRPTNQIMQLASRTDLAELLYTEEIFPGDDAMAALYRSVTCLVQPYRGESFCLPVLEAMACGIPAIVTRGGATDDFVTAECGYHVDAKRVPSWPPPGEELAGPGWFLEPDIDQIAAAMRSVYEDPEDAQR
ncbi:MAG: glycosyltransferase family 4 protein, partial [Vulcanimicrobiaceae bacterium]